MARVIAAATDGVIAYQGDAEPEAWDGQDDWRRFLDLLDEVGGATTADGLFRRFVAGPADPVTLDERLDARAQLAELVARGDGWAAPVAVRQQMAEWHFDGAVVAMRAAGGVLDTRDEIDDVLAPFGAGAPAELEETYESAESLDDVQAEADDDLDAARAVVDADGRFHAGHGLLGAVGLLGSDAPSRLDDAYEALADGDADAARAAAADVVGTVDGAGTAGVVRVLGLVLLLGALVVLAAVVRPRLRSRRARRAFTAAEERAAHAEAAAPTEVDSF
jgi:hypothetical protein